MLPQSSKIRTDLALESANTVATEEKLPEGIAVNSRKTESFLVTEVKITTTEASEKIEKPKGRYITLERESSLDFTLQGVESCAKEIAYELSKILGNPRSVLVVGLGNMCITPDSLGPRVGSHIFATRHIHFNAPQLAYEGLKIVSTISPGVMGQTGIEVSEILEPLCKKLLPEVVVAIDSLACSQVSHLGKTIQITDTGISPGSGVLNARKELSKATLGVPTVAIGVPTVATLAGEETLMVTPKNIDKLISTSASLISSGINLCLHPSLSLEEINLLTS